MLFVIEEDIYTYRGAFEAAERMLNGHLARAARARTQLLLSNGFAIVAVQRVRHTATGERIAIVDRYQQIVCIVKHRIR